MIEAKRLLADLKKLRKRLDDDLRRYHDQSPGRAAVEAEWRAAFDAKRTADTFETFWTAALDQAAVHWILGLVFLRFLEDNRLLDRPLLSGAGERMELAQERQRAFFRARPQDSDAEYLIETFAEAARLPGLAGLYDPAHNPLFRLPVSGDGAMALLGFFRARVPETGALLHDFADPEWNTRFLGDLYQDLSEEARKRFALLQTPDFVEQWILDRTLDRAIGEFGHERVRMIDPACGSGHFLLGGFARLLTQWHKYAPDMPPAAQAQKVLDAVSGVDINPFAVAIARYRLLLAALRAAEETRLAAAPDFRLSLAVGDSLFHGRHFFERTLGGVAEGYRRTHQHHFATEDTAALDAILGRQYHAVVGNPPYIQAKDAAMRDAYRDIYTSCHGKYALVAPFIERFFDLAQLGTRDQAPGFVGLIVANNFMKREFGAKLIEAVLPHLDLTHVVDCSGAYIPGHGTPTVILFGRNRPPIESVVRTVRGIRGEPSAPEQPARGFVWSAIVAQTDVVDSTSDFINAEDTQRDALARHPWNIGGGGATEVQEVIEGDHSTLAQQAKVGVMAVTGEDDAFVRPFVADFVRMGMSSDVRTFVEGDRVRDWRIAEPFSVYFPYTDRGEASISSHGNALLWPFKSTLGAGIYFGKTKAQREMFWQEYAILVKSKADNRPAITFAFVATHNQFVLERGGKVFNRTAPVIKLPEGASEDDHLGLLGRLNSSTACFWMKQTFMDRGNGGIGGGIANELWERFYEHDAGKVGRFPISSDSPLDLARTLDTEAQLHAANLPPAICARLAPTRETLDAARAEAEATRARMIALQEELDWRCYRLYGLHDDPPEHPDPPPLQLGERAFEIVMARRMAEGVLETAWFARHRSTPITELPAHWPDSYRAIVERRIALIERDATIGLIERPEYKRRWSIQAWEEMERDALRLWLLDRLEGPHFWPVGRPQLTSIRHLADAARRDADFLSVATLYAAPGNLDLDALVAELVGREAVPFLAVLRYTESGRRKRADWEATWDKQRAEDAIDAEFADRPAEAKRRKQEVVGAIPVPPKYKGADFVSNDIWRLRGGLDVPKERFVSFPHCARDIDGTLPVLWAGYDQLARAKAIAAWYVERKDSDGWAAPRLVPLLAGLLELVPWLRQWHNDVDRETGLRMGDYFADFIAEEARVLELAQDELRAWTPPAPARKNGARRNGRRAAA